MPVVRDPQHPDFPHGTNAGYHRGCQKAANCPSKTSCTATHRRLKKLAKFRREGGAGARGVPAAPVLEHVRSLLEAVPDATIRSVCCCAGVHASVVPHMERRGVTTRSTAAALLAVRPGHLAESTARVDADQVRVMARKLQAAGYPVSWQVRESRNPTLHKILHERNADRYVYRESYEKMLTLYERVSRRAPDFELDGLTAGQITRAKNTAAAKGFYPPFAYDDDGNLDLRSVPDHPWRIADQTAETALDMAYALVTIAPTDGQKAARVSIHADDSAGKKRCQRTVTKLGLRFVDENRHTLGVNEWWRLNGPTATRVRDACTDYFEGRTGPVETVLALDLVSVGAGNGTVPPEHPEVIAYAEANPESRVAAQLTPKAESDRARYQEKKQAILSAAA